MPAAVETYCVDECAIKREEQTSRNTKPGIIYYWQVVCALGFNDPSILLKKIIVKENSEMAKWD